MSLTVIQELDLIGADLSMLNTNASVEMVFSDFLFEYDVDNVATHMYLEKVYESKNFELMLEILTQSFQSLKTDDDFCVVTFVYGNVNFTVFFDEVEEAVQRLEHLGLH